MNPQNPGLLHNTILANPQLTNLGIMKSPGTGSMILSMYYPLFEGQKCIGYVGVGVYASRLMDVLLDLNIEGLPNSKYVFLNVETGCSRQRTAVTNDDISR